MSKKTSSKSTKKAPAKKAPAKKAAAKKSAPKKSAPKKAAAKKASTPDISDAAKSLIDQQIASSFEKIDELIDSVPAQVTVNTSGAKSWIRKFFKNLTK